MSEPTKVFVLFGETGEYSDHSEWVVRAYTTKDAADVDCAALNAIAGGEAAGRLSWDEREGVIARLKQHDADATIDYTGTHYLVAEVPLATAPQVLADRPPSGDPNP